MGFASQLLAVLVVATGVRCSHAQGQPLSEFGSIVYAPGDPAVSRAALLLQQQLESARGVHLPLVVEGVDNPVPGPSFFVGATAVSQPVIDDAKLPADWDSIVVRSVPEGVVLAGSTPRSTIYAVTDLLEHQCGVVWLTVFDPPHVVPMPVVEIPFDLDVVEVSAFGTRDIIPAAPVRIDRSDAFVALRINGPATDMHRPGADLLSAEWGGPFRTYRTSWLAHTLVPGGEWLDGSCLADPSLVEYLAGLIVQDGLYHYSLAEFADRPDYCGCGCGGPFVSDQLIGLLNSVALSVDGAPAGWELETLAYQDSIIAPTSGLIHPRVVTRWAHLNRHQYEPIDSPGNTVGAECLEEWAQLCAASGSPLAVWDYPMSPLGDQLPEPGMAKYCDDLEHYRDSGVRDVYYEYESGFIFHHNMADLRVRLITRLMWDPDLGHGELAQRFCDFYYGPGSARVMDYLALLDEAYQSSKDAYGPADSFRNLYDTLAEHIALGGAGGWTGIIDSGNYQHGSWGADDLFHDDLKYRFFSLGLFLSADALFEDALASVADHPDACVFRPRIEMARLSQDRALIYYEHRLRAQHGGGNPFPFDMDDVKRRYRRVSIAALRSRAPEDADMAFLHSWEDVGLPSLFDRASRRGAETGQYGEFGDEILVGDWDGDGKDELTAYREGRFYFQAYLAERIASFEVPWGEVGDEFLVGDWDGDGDKELASRRADRFYFQGQVTDLNSSLETQWGEVGDEILVGDWDGDGDDELASRRADRYYFQGQLADPVAKHEMQWGEVGDEIVVGDWDGDGDDELASRRGNRFFVQAQLTDLVAPHEVVWGASSEEILVGDWDGDGDDELARRAADLLRYQGRLLPENPFVYMCEADLAPPVGSLDFSDVIMFLTLFGSEDPIADLASPCGVWDFSDVLEFLAAFGAGCP